MVTHVIFCGPSTAGKTTLMLGLTEINENLQFTVDRTLTTRPRRNNEDDRENIFLNPSEFKKKRRDLLFTFQNSPSYEYGIIKPDPLTPNEVRMRILLPEYAAKFRELIDEPSVVCSISPPHSDPTKIFLERGTDDMDMQARLKRFYTDKTEADEYADLSFQNFEGAELATRSLASFLIGHIRKKDLS